MPVKSATVVFTCQCKLTTGITGRSIGRRRRVKLAVKIAVLRVRAIAEIRPQAVKPPAFGGQQLALRLEPRVRVPELRAQEHAAKGLGAAGVDEAGLRFGRA